MSASPFSLSRAARETHIVNTDPVPVGVSGRHRISLHTAIDGWDRWLKRLQDVVVAVIAITLLSPLMLGVALAIKLDSPGPIIFRQKRIGLNGSIFELWKFRSMHAEHTDPGATCQTGRGDPRVTRVGRLIRRSSIDELPQFFNVLQGWMSVVGPRPHALETRAEGQLLEDLVNNYTARHRVKPGLTGWAQINGLRGEIDSSKNWSSGSNTTPSISKSGRCGSI